VNHIHSEQQRNLQAALFHGDPLDLPDFFHPFDVEKAPHLACLDLGSHIGAGHLPGGDITRRRQIQLSQLLLQGHFLHQVADKTVHLRIAGGSTPVPAGYRQQQGGHDNKRFSHPL